MSKRAIVTGGSGYFGQILVEKLLEESWVVLNIDLNSLVINHPNYSFFKCDIRNYDKLNEYIKESDIIFHCVAQVPLAKNISDFWSVNSNGTENICKIANKKKIKKLVYISSSAIFGAPDSNPVDEKTVPFPAEEYGKAKLEGEKICKKYSLNNLNVTIIRPRTILGHGRLGIMQMLFEWISKNKTIPVIDGGKNVYQFIHADDLADACLLSEKLSKKNYEVYNIGSEKFGTMFDLLNNLIKNINSKSQIKTIPIKLFETIGNIMYLLNTTPLGPYHHLMYGRSLWFDISKAKKDLGFSPKYSSDEMILNSYKHYLSDNNVKKNIDELSHHKSNVKKKLLYFAPTFINLIGKKIK